MRLLFNCLNCAVLLLIVAQVSTATTIYKYKDADGKWVFSDKKPASEDQNLTSFEYKDKETRKSHLEFSTIEKNGQYFLWVKNKMFAPVEVELDYQDGDSLKKLVGANDRALLDVSDKAFGRLKYRYVIGDPDLQIARPTLHYPFTEKRSFKVTQGFHGSFSHFKAPNLYAIDIAMPVGTYLTAVKEGIVIGVKDDYHMGGTRQFYLDKANYVMVLHDDGSYATYAHILLGSAMVKPGDKVSVGQRLARSGSSGYSSGPHLHFVIRKNVGMKTESIPFVFKRPNGELIKPRRGMELVLP